MLHHRSLVLRELGRYALLSWNKLDPENTKYYDGGMATFKVLPHFRSILLTALSLCLALPLHLFCNCACPTACCSASKVVLLEKAKASQLEKDRSESKPCCSQCRSNENQSTERLDQSQPKPDRTKQPCHCLAQRALLGYLKSDGQSKKSDQIHDLVSDLVNVVADSRSAQSQTSQVIERIPLTHHRRLALLGTWLN